MLETLGHILGRRVTYKDVSFKTFSKAGVAQGFQPLELSQLRHYFEDLKGGAFAAGGPTNHVLEVTGQAPEDFETMAGRYIKDPSRIYPVVKIGTKAQAIGFLMKMLVTKAPDLDAWERDRGYPLLNKPVLAPDSAEWRVTAERQLLHLLPAASSVAPDLELVS